ncbi:MAG: FAD-binding oxidoreductase [Gammaproteobacteria bacterium]|nr:FAD-binding oxidoreductase [Gammaproteobacteria bacterium]
MPPLYHPDIYDVSRPVPSYWEDNAPVSQQGFEPLDTDESCDVAIIGGGYTGLSAALHLARDYGIQARVLEAGHVGWGASGRNGGFCCMPATKLSIPELIRRYGLEETQHFYRAQMEAIDLVRSLGEEEGIDYDKSGEGILDVADKPSRMQGLRQEHDALKKLFGIDSELIDKKKFQQNYFDCAELEGGLLVHAGFGLNPMKFVGGLGKAAVRRGAVVHGKSPVTGWRKENGVHHLRTPRGTLTARQVIVAVNGFIREELNAALDASALPAISNIIVTRPLSNDELQAHAWRNTSPAVTTKKLHNYFRLLPDRRFLIGGRGDYHGSAQSGQAMRAELEARFHELFPNWREVSVSHFWRGLVCVTRRLSPCIGRLDDDQSVWYGFGYHGNGVCNAPWAGMMIARNMAGANRDLAGIPKVMRGLSPSFVFPGLRLWMLRAAYTYYRIKDAL